MIFYFFPRDTAVGIATYQQSIIPDLEVYAGLPTNITLLDYFPPMSVRFEIPSAVNVVQALGYSSIASLGDAVLNPHQWTFQFPVFVNDLSKDFISFALTYLRLSRPVAIWAILRSPDQSEYTHFISNISVLTEVNFQVPTNANATLSLTFSSPFTHVFQDEERQLGIMRPPSVNERSLTVRDLRVQMRVGSDPYSEEEVLSFSISGRRQVYWHWTSVSPRHSLVARRAPTMFTATPVTLQGNVTLGYPFNYSDLQAAAIQPIQEMKVSMRNLLDLTIFGFKINSWVQDLSADSARFTVNFSFIEYLVE